MSAGRVCVLGAGVVGLSSALAVSTLLPSCRVTVVARDFTPHTTSDGAFGLWEPYLLQHTPADDIKRWGAVTLGRMQQLAHSAEGPAAGTFTFSGCSIFKQHCQDPMWKDMVPFFRHMGEKELKQYGPQFVHGWAFQSAATECRFYLPWLTDKLKERGVIFVQAHVSDLGQLALDYDVVVNCTGLGSHDLLKDDLVSPIQGQVIRVHAPWVKHFLNSDNEDVYILPGIDSVVLGGSHVERSWSTEVEKVTRDRILQSCQRIMPSLKHARVQADWVGLRPSRTRVRLEAELLHTPHGHLKVVHNYGHGGAGITLHWGCALDAAAMVKDCLQGAPQARI